MNDLVYASSRSIYGAAGASDWNLRRQPAILKRPTARCKVQLTVISSQVDADPLHAGVSAQRDSVWSIHPDSASTWS